MNLYAYLAFLFLKMFVDNLIIFAHICSVGVTMMLWQVSAMLSTQHNILNNKWHVVNNNIHMK